jgi:predicted glutamine amidotransferase
MARHPKGADGPLAARVALRLLELNEARGKHATGLAWLDADGTKGVAKAAVPASLFLASDKMAMVPRAPHILLAHTRHATQQNAHRDDCAHPFEIEGLIGAHNGIVYNYPEVAKTLNVEVDVDSEVIFHAIAQRAKKKAGDVGRALYDLDGYWAISFMRGRTLWLCRSDDAQLHVAYVARLSAMFWSSTSSDLAQALSEFKLDGKVVAINKDTWYQFIPDRFGPDQSNSVKYPAKFDGKRRKASQRDLARTSGGSRSWSDPFWQDGARAVTSQDVREHNARRRAEAERDQASLFVPREDYDALAKRLEALEAKYEGLVDALLQAEILPPDADPTGDDVEPSTCSTCGEGLDAGTLTMRRGKWFHLTC